MTCTCMLRGLQHRSLVGTARTDMYTWSLSVELRTYSHHYHPNHHHEDPVVALRREMQELRPTAVATTSTTGVMSCAWSRWCTYLALDIERFCTMYLRGTRRVEQVLEPSGCEACICCHCIATLALW